MLYVRRREEQQKLSEFKFGDWRIVRRQEDHHILLLGLLLGERKQTRFNFHPEEMANAGGIQELGCHHYFSSACFDLKPTKLASLLLHCVSPSSFQSSSGAIKIPRC